MSAKTAVVMAAKATDANEDTNEDTNENISDHTRHVCNERWLALNIPAVSFGDSEKYVIRHFDYEIAPGEVLKNLPFIPLLNYTDWMPTAVEIEEMKLRSATGKVHSRQLGASLESSRKGKTRPASTKETPDASALMSLMGATGDARTVAATFLQVPKNCLPKAMEKIPAHDVMEYYTSGQLAKDVAKEPDLEFQILQGGQCQPLCDKTPGCKWTQALRRQALMRMSRIDLFAMCAVAPYQNHFQRNCYLQFLTSTVTQMQFLKWCESIGGDCSIDEDKKMRKQVAQEKTLTKEFKAQPAMIPGIKRYLAKSEWEFKWGKRLCTTPLCKDGKHNYPWLNPLTNMTLRKVDKRPGDPAGALGRNSEIYCENAQLPWLGAPKRTFAVVPRMEERGCEPKFPSCTANAGPSGYSAFRKAYSAMCTNESIPKCSRDLLAPRLVPLARVDSSGCTACPGPDGDDQIGYYPGVYWTQGVGTGISGQVECVSGLDIASSGGEVARCSPQGGILLTPAVHTPNVSVPVSCMSLGLKKNLYAAMADMPFAKEPILYIKINCLVYKHVFCLTTKVHGKGGGSYTRRCATHKESTFVYADTCSKRRQFCPGRSPVLEVDQKAAGCVNWDYRKCANFEIKSRKHLTDRAKYPASSTCIGHSNKPAPAGAHGCVTPKQEYCIDTCEEEHGTSWKGITAKQIKGLNHYFGAAYEAEKAPPLLVMPANHDRSVGKEWHYVYEGIKKHGSVRAAAKFQHMAKTMGMCAMVVQLA